ncbi:hypothetical protein [Nocardioides sp. GCM10030258]|uniref:hypothetical protein n=1 Tax=unclassified Nocardioides TaxID=2615069 RepID=UPI00360A238D
MRMPEEWLGYEAESRMIDGHAQATAPVALWAHMSTLTGGAKPIASLVERRIEGGNTEWRSIWLTDTLIAYVAARKAKEGWSAHSQGSRIHQPDAMSGWARPVRSVVEIQLGDAKCWKERSYDETGGPGCGRVRPVS